MKKSTSLSMLVVGLAASSCAPADPSKDAEALLAGVSEDPAARALSAPVGGAHGVPDDTARTIGADEAALVAEEVADIYRPFAAARSATITIAPERKRGPPGGAAERRRGPPRRAPNVSSARCARAYA
ncbi:hypothetical protein [Sorangium sp. So ce394]|uniref:hypothetical protein n=1 Tax=Sorangium sp. So ce394 TaxID=3133310 RepID=UPI003F5AFCB9